MKGNILTKEILESYLKGLYAIEALVEEIFGYIKSNYEKYLKFGKYSCLDEWKLDEDSLQIKYYDYGYDLYEYSWFEDIPLDTLFNDTWKEFIDVHFNKLKAEKEANKVANEAKEKEMRKKLFEELKQEFEDGDKEIQAF